MTDSTSKCADIDPTISRHCDLEDGDDTDEVEISMRLRFRGGWRLSAASSSSSVDY